MTPTYARVREGKSLILVVDDDSLNRRMLRHLLETQLYEVREAAGGLEALEQVAREEPDVILLDVVMPEPDGVEVCRRLKENPKTAHIPVLMVTVLADKLERLRGIAAGANDYLSKPVDKEDVILRVRNALYMKGLFDRVHTAYEQLQEMESLRDNLTHMIVHDIRTPLSVVKGHLDLLARGNCGPTNEMQGKSIAQALGATQEIMRMVNMMLDVSRLEERKMPIQPESCDVKALINESLSGIEVLLAGLQVSIRATPDPLVLECDADLIKRVILNLTVNAAKAMVGKGELGVEAKEEGEFVRFSISDTGPGIPAEHQEAIFQKFVRLDGHETGRYFSTGLGLTFCKLAVESQGGTIGVDSEVGKGSTFWFSLPGKAPPGIATASP